jgi:hypothetical protein
MYYRSIGLVLLSLVLLLAACNGPSPGEPTTPAGIWD